MTYDTIVVTAVSDVGFFKFFYVFNFENFF